MTTPMLPRVLLRSVPPRLCVRSVEFRAESVDGDGHTLEGYAAVFRSPTVIDSWEGTFEEEVARGAFRKTLSERTPVLQFDHGRDMRTGSVPIGQIEDLREDTKGLFVLARLFDNPVVEPIRQAIEGGAIDGMSFRFEVMKDRWHDKNGVLVKPDELNSLLWTQNDRSPLKRTLLEVKLFELGPVVFPAYEDTSVGVRSILAGLDETQRRTLIEELVAELQSDAARQGTSDSDSTSAPPTVGTRGLIRDRLLAGINARKA